MQEKYNSPQVSVIIPVYNVERFMKKCLDSVQRQTFENIEVIIVNDGSTDSSLKICKTYAEADFRFKVYSQKNQGQASARNNAIKKACGKYILFVDADDWIENNIIEKCIREFEKNDNLDLCFFNWQKEYIDGSAPDDIQDWYIFQKEFPNNEESLPSQAIQYVLDGALQNYVWSFMVRKKVFQDGEIEFPINMYFEDIYIYFSILGKCNRIGYIKDVLYHYVQHAKSTTHIFDLKHMEDYFHAINEQVKYIEMNERSLLKNAILYATPRYLYFYWTGYMYMGKAFEESDAYKNVKCFIDKYICVLKINDFGRLNDKIKFIMYKLNLLWGYGMAMKLRRI